MRIILITFIGCVLLIAGTTNKTSQGDLFFCTGLILIALANIAAAIREKS